MSRLQSIVLIAVVYKSIYSLLNTLLVALVPSCSTSGCGLPCLVPGELGTVTTAVPEPLVHRIYREQRAHTGQDSKVHNLEYTAASN